MVEIGRRVGLPTRAVLTAMEAPLGRAVGNALEVIESIETLKGRGPADVTELSVTLASQMLVVAGTGRRRGVGAGAGDRASSQAARRLDKIPRRDRAAGRGRLGRGRLQRGWRRPRAREDVTARREPDSSSASTPSASGAPRCCWAPAASGWTRPSTTAPASCCASRCGDQVQAGQSLAELRHRASRPTRRRAGARVRSVRARRCPSRRSAVDPRRRRITRAL